MDRFQAVPGGRITVDVDPDGWPFHIGIGTDEQPAMPERYKDRRGIVRARASRTVPNLGRGQFDVTVRDRLGITKVGTLTIA